MSSDTLTGTSVLSVIAAADPVFAPQFSTRPVSHRTPRAIPRPVSHRTSQAIPRPVSATPAVAASSPGGGRHSAGERGAWDTEDAR
ncbi:hypothetical protein JK359_30355 [Streptomyces actinomycinicus]|uniref:Uncharacterized protein n=1 Tax=Streptomyces actinomycinicus TaxID=1695166 RepID=A0A937JRZ3_9ACTN|nr:hypothetical protein [Streptomyces actinomycinicus]MBL1086217.1 hypothetical protein [Streptomyces actinomycinicus]